MGRQALMEWICYIKRNLFEKYTFKWIRMFQVLKEKGKLMLLDFSWSRFANNLLNISNSWKFIISPPFLVDYFFASFHARNKLSLHFVIYNPRKILINYNDLRSLLFALVSFLPFVKVLYVLISLLGEKLFYMQHLYFDSGLFWTDCTSFQSMN
jgi:hypothetical protein